MHACVAIGSLVLCGCNSHKKQTANVLEKMIGSKVDLCTTQMECKQQPIVSECDKYKMVVYVDSTECTPCALSHLRYWNPIIKETKKYNVCYVFVIAPKKEEIFDINVEMEVTDLTNSIYLDKDYIFLKRNEYIPHEEKYNTFLLDEHNEIVLVGNPINNEQIKNMYYNILKDRVTT